MRIRKQLVAFIILGLCLALSCVITQAQTTFTLNVDGCSAGCGGAVPYATVTLTQEGSNVLVTENLNPTYAKGFVATGAGNSLELNITGDPVIAINGGGFFFASDGANGNTGNIADNTPGVAVVTPEPASMLLFGSGLLALGAVLRRRKGTAIGA